jgi:SAM-dependent methyltransferase
MRWLHDHGLQALGVDRDAQAGVDLQALGLEFLLADLEQEPWPFAPQSMDAVLVTHYLWRPLWSDLKAVLKPHGLLIYETFSSGHEALGRPKNPDFLLRPGELLEVFADFHIIAFEEGLEPHPPRLLQRLVAQKPMSFTERPATALRSLE